MKRAADRSDGRRKTKKRVRVHRDSQLLRRWFCVSVTSAPPDQEPATFKLKLQRNDFIKPNLLLVNDVVHLCRRVLLIVTHKDQHDFAKHAAFDPRSCCAVTPFGPLNPRRRRILSLFKAPGSVYTKCNYSNEPNYTDKNSMNAYGLQPFFFVATIYTFTFVFQTLLYRKSKENRIFKAA